MYAPAQTPTENAEAAHVAQSSTPPAASAAAKRTAWLFLVVVVVALAVGIGRRVVVEQERAVAQAELVAGRRVAMSGPPEVIVARPTPFAYDPHFSITGTLDPIQQADLGFNVAGRLIRVEVTLGQRVEAGTVLAALDRRSVAAQGQLASSMAQAADAQLAMAQDRLDRATQLHARGATSDAELTAATQQLALAQAQLGQARAQGRLSAADGSNHTIRAPFAGTITRVPDGIGNVVMPGQALFRIEDLSALVLRSGITERALPRVRVGDAVELENSPVRGTIRSFAMSLDPVTRRAPIEIGIDNPDGSLIGHALVKGSILTNRPYPAMRVPATAIRGDQTVLIVNGQGKIEVRRVEALVETDGTGVVLFGLTQADQVVVRPSADLTTGRTVRATTGTR
jgi:RND family efflux transporter MFP subunit